ncbi:MAG: OmpA family protein [Spirochaetales bacterium]|nr:OmpA family protein [Spirochaetales bacterium]
MKNTPVFILTLIFCSLPFLMGQEKPIYPGKITYLSPSYAGSLEIGSGVAGWGGGLSGGLDWGNTSRETYIGLHGGYAFLAKDDQVSALLPWGEFRGGLIFHPLDLFRLNTYCGVGFVSNSPAMTLGSSADFRLLDRNYLFLDVSCSLLPELEEMGRRSVRVGIKRTIPILRKVPPVNLNISLSSSVFSPDGDGDRDLLILYLTPENPSSVQSWRGEIVDRMGNPVIDWSGRGAPPEQIVWDGYGRDGEMVFSASDYTLRILTVDKLGNRESRELSFITDVFVEKVEDQLRIRVPGILFSSGEADFAELNEEELRNNEEIISRLKVILEKFPDYKIRIEGYGNLLNWASEEKARIEQEEVLIPLSYSRAARIRDYLVEKGIERDRLEVVGRGGESPIVPFSDEENRWKNRRVEFILLK